MSAARPPERRIVFVSTSTMLGGGEYFLIELLPRLHELGWDVTLVVPPRAPLAEHAGLAAVTRIVPLDLSMHIWPARAFLHSAGVFLKWARRERGALFYGNGFFTMKLLLLARAFAGVRRTVIHLHESSYEWYPTPRARLQAPWIGRFAAISEAVRREFVAGSRVPFAKVELVYNGVPVSRDPPEKNSIWRWEERVALALPTDCLLVGMAARTNVLKGHETLLRAWRKVLDASPTASPPRLLIIGLRRGEPEETALFDRLRDLIAAERLASSLLILGEEPLERVRRIMAAADVWTVPSTSEGFGRTAIEAMAEGTALVASRVGGLAEIVNDGHDGVLVPPGDPGALASALLVLLGDSARRNALAAAGRATANARFSVEAMADRISALCDSVPA